MSEVNDLLHMADVKLIVEYNIVWKLATSLSYIQETHLFASIQVVNFT